MTASAAIFHGGFLMKLNLWLIANQLAQNYDIETKISFAVDRTISGPLPVESQGVIYVREEGSDILCQAEQGTIIIHDVEGKEGLLLVQSIFNWYDNWLENVDRALRDGDYRMFVHFCAQAFSNPVMLQDSNSLLLGMDCRGIPIGRIPEWRFLYETDQCSVAYYLAMSEALNRPVRKYNDSVYRFNTCAQDEKGEDYQTSGLLARFRFLAHDYGQLTVLDKKRPLNPGDVALLEVLADRASLYFAAAERSDSSAVNLRIMDDLLEMREVSGEQLAYHYSLITRNAPENSGRLCLFLFRCADETDKTALLSLLSTILTRQYPTLYSWAYHEDLLYAVYVPEPNILAQQMYTFISAQGYSRKLQVGISLPFDDILQLPYHYEQAVYAVRHSDRPGLFFFYDCGSRYLLENSDPHRRLMACEPMCRRIWEKEPDKREFLLTLSAYLRTERSTSLAAERLFIHRNTVNYRIRYLKDFTGWDYENDILRDYLRLSIYTLSH